MILKNTTNMTQGYFFLGLGKYYIDESINLLKTIKKFDNKRLFGIMVNQEDYQYVKELNLFNSIVINDYSHALYQTTKTSFEKYCLIPRITFNEYLPFEETIILDSDILCISNPDNMWEYFSSNSQDFNMTGFEWDENWHWDTIKNISEIIGKSVPHTHGGVFYIRNKEKLKDYFNLCHEVYHKYDEYGLLQNFRGGRVDEPIFAVAMAISNMLPLDFIEYPIITFNLPGNTIFPTKLQTVNDLNIECKEFIPFVHMFEKSIGNNYKQILNKIVN